MQRSLRVSLYGVLSLLMAVSVASAQPAPGCYLPPTDIRDLVLIYQGGSPPHGL